jgi:REP element-mobilizing transposase RayT
MSEPLAYRITWRTYGSWLPGSNDGWVKHKTLGIREVSEPLEKHARTLMTQDAVELNAGQRAIVEQTIRDHCRIRGWTLHAANARSNHVHVVVSADIHPNQVMSQFKAWCSRHLIKATELPPAKWWAIHGSTKWINDPTYLEDAIRYVVEGQ